MADCSPRPKLGSVPPWLVELDEKVRRSLGVFVHTFEFMTSSSRENDVCYLFRHKSGSYDLKRIDDTYEVKRKVKALTSRQIRAARGLLRWSAEDLAREAALGLATIRRAEGAENETSMTIANDLAVRRALEWAGVEFIDENGGGPGVRMRKRTLKKE